MEDAIKASLQTAEREAELRQRELQEQQELDRIFALTAEESQQQLRLAREEEQVLQQALAESLREAEKHSQQVLHEEGLLLEEARQHSLRHLEESAKLEFPRRTSSHYRQQSFGKLDTSTICSSAPEQRGQRALPGIDFGYTEVPFAPHLDKTHLPTTQSAISAASYPSSPVSTTPGKLLFPPSIELSSIYTAPRQNRSTAAFLDRHETQSYFVIRAYSWKSLLRALAWYGNSRIEAAPEDVAAASDRERATRRSGRCVLQAEVEFVTPTRVDKSIGMGEHVRTVQSVGVVSKGNSPAHVALYLSLLPVDSSSRSSPGDAVDAWHKSKEYDAIKRESRRLDAWYAGQGSTRRLIQLNRQPPLLPVAMVEVAQFLHASHSYSAACPSSGSVARHSPRDLHHAIERHDEGFVRKQQAMLAANSALAPKRFTSGSASSSSNTSPDPHLSASGPSQSSTSTEPSPSADGDDPFDDDEDDLDFNDLSLIEHGMPTDGSFDAQDKLLMGKRQRLKAKVKRRLAKRSADGKVVNEDLATWITPFDLSQHG